MSDEDIKRFLKWLTEEGCSIESPASVVASAAYSGPALGIFASREIKKDELLARIPKSCILSVRTCSVASIIEANELDELEVKSHFFAFRHLDTSAMYPHFTIVYTRSLDQVLYIHIKHLHAAAPSPFPNGPGPHLLPPP